MDKQSKRNLEALAETVKFGQVSELEAQSRRVWIQNLGLISASAAVLWNCSSKDEAEAVPVGFDAATDAKNYALALALENDAISTYMAAATLPNIATASAANLNGAVLAIAGGFLAHHQAHAAKLVAAIEALRTSYPDAGITAAAAIATTAVSVPDALVALLVDSTYGIVNTLRLAAAKELAAAQAYVSLIPKFTDVKNAMLHGAIGADEAGHYGVLRGALLALLVDSRDTSLTATSVIATAFIDETTAASTAPA